MFLQGFNFHLRARNLAPSTIAASADYLGRFLDGHDPLTVTRSDIENYLVGMRKHPRKAHEKSLVYRDICPLSNETAHLRMRKKMDPR